MGRAEDRKRAKSVKRKLTPEQFERLLSNVNKELVNDEVEKRIATYQRLWTDCMIEAFKKCGYSLDKARAVLDQVELIMLQKVEDRRNGKS